MSISKVFLTTLTDTQKKGKKPKKKKKTRNK